MSEIYWLAAFTIGQLDTVDFGIVELPDVSLCLFAETEFSSEKTLLTEGYG